MRSIGDTAFKYCTSLTDVIWNAVNCTYAGNYTVTKASNGNYYYYDYTLFYGCNKLKNITIDENVETIPDYAFYGCSKLTDIIIPDSVTSIGRQAFYECSSLTRVTIGNGVTSIGRSAFSECASIESLTIGNGVTSIDRYAFYYCSSLTTINYKGGKEQWDAISKGYRWNEGAYNYTINYNYVEN